MNLAEIRTALEDRLREVLPDGWHVADTLEELVAPGARVEYPTSLEYEATMGLSRAVWSVVLVVSPTDDEDALEHLDRILSRRTDGSVIDRLALAGGPWRSARVIGAENIGPREFGDGAYLAADLGLEVLA